MNGQMMGLSISLENVHLEAAPWLRFPIVSPWEKDDGSGPAGSRAVAEVALANVSLQRVEVHARAVLRVDEAMWEGMTESQQLKPGCLWKTMGA